MKENIPNSGRGLLLLVAATALLTLAIAIWALAGDPHPSVPGGGSTPDVPLDSPRAAP